VTFARTVLAGGSSRAVLVPAAAAAIIGALVLSGCGTSHSPAQTVIAAARSTLSENIDSTTTLKGATAFGGGSAGVVTQGTFALPTGLGYEAIDFPASGAQPVGGGYLVFTATNAYLEPRSTDLAPLKGKTWISVPLDGSRPLESAFPRLLEQLEGLTPWLLLDEVVWGATSVSSAGQRVVNHLPLTEYVVTVALRPLLSKVSGPTGAAIRVAVSKELQALAAARPGERSPSLRVTVWINGPGLVSAVRASVPGSGLGTASMTFSDFGVAIPTNPPLQTAVVDLTDLLPAAKGPFSPWVLGSAP